MKVAHEDPNEYIVEDNDRRDREELERRWKDEEKQSYIGEHGQMKIYVESELIYVNEHEDLQRRKAKYDKYLGTLIEVKKQTEYE